MRIDVEQLRGATRNLNRFLEFEREVEESVRQEHILRVQDIDEAKRAREKRARKKRLRKLRSAQAQ